MPRLLAPLACTVLVLLVDSAGLVRAQGEMVIAREGTKLYHRPGCDLVRDAKDVLAMTRAQAEARSLKPHPECDPAVSSGKDPAAAKAPTKPAMVLIDIDGKFYHRDKCVKLSKTSRLVTVTEASKKHWPCRTCKPPIRPRPGKGRLDSAVAAEAREDRRLQVGF